MRANVEICPHFSLNSVNWNGDPEGGGTLLKYNFLANLLMFDLNLRNLKYKNIFQWKNPSAEQEKWKSHFMIFFPHSYFLKRSINVFVWKREKCASHNLYIRCKNTRLFSFWSHFFCVCCLPLSSMYIFFIILLSIILCLCFMK